MNRVVGVTILLVAFSAAGMTAGGLMATTHSEYGVAIIVTSFAFFVGGVAGFVLWVLLTDHVEQPAPSRSRKTTAEPIDTIADADYQEVSRGY